MNIWHKIKCQFGFHNYELLGSYYDTGTTILNYTDYEMKHIYLKSLYRCKNCGILCTCLVHDYIFYYDVFGYDYDAKLADINKRFMSKDDLFLTMVNKGYIPRE